MLRPEIDETSRYIQTLALEGQRIFIGGEWESSRRGAPGAISRGIFAFVREADGWELEGWFQPGLGGAVIAAAMGVDAMRICVGAPYADGPAGNEQGAAGVFRQEEDKSWSLKVILQRSDELLAHYDRFGHSVATEGDLLVVGAPGDDDETGKNRGAAYFYRRIGDEWELWRKLLPLDAQADDNFGCSVALSGSRIAICAGGADTPVAADAGAVYVYQRQGDDLVLEGRLHAAEGASGNRFGNAVALDGDRMIVGEYRADEGEESDTGAAYVFARVDEAWVQQARLVASDPTANAKFGVSVDIDGVHAVVGAYRAGNDYCGAAYVFAESAETWTEEERLSVLDAGESIWFGLAVGIDGETVAVGAPHVDNPGGANVGRVFVFSRTDNGWERTASLWADPPSAGQQFGEALAFRDGRLAVSAGSERSPGMGAHGAAYLMHSADGQWSQLARLAASDRHEHQYFGRRAIAVDGSRMVVGAPYDGNNTIFVPGAAYSYETVCSADVDGDWLVDDADLLALLSSYGTTSGAIRRSGDLDGDGDVDLVDLATLLGAYGTTCP